MHLPPHQAAQYNDLYLQRGSASPDTMRKMKAKPAGYSRTQITLHWLVAALIVFQFVMHDAIVATWAAIVKGESPQITPVVWAHIAAGSLVLAFGLWRLVLRFKRGAPPLPENEHPVGKGLAHLTHFLLYALMILMPVSGLATWFGGSETADFLHTTLKIPLMILVVLHFAGALFQQFYLKTGLISRMMRADETTQHDK